MAKLPNTIRKTFTTYKVVWDRLMKIALSDPEKYPYGISGIIRTALNEWLERYEDAQD